MKTFSSKLFFMAKTRRERCPYCLQKGEAYKKGKLTFILPIDFTHYFSHSFQTFFKQSRINFIFK